MVNLQNDGTKNAHIMKSASMRWYGSMEKNAKYNKTAVEKFKRKPYQIAGGNKNGNDK